LHKIVGCKTINPKMSLIEPIGVFCVASLVMDGIAMTFVKFIGGCLSSSLQTFKLNHLVLCEKFKQNKKIMTNVRIM
jgi:hypothetical protein